MLDAMIESQSEMDDDLKLSEKEILDNIGIFFLAGHETTANAIAFGMLCIAKYPNIQIKLRNEIFENVQNVTSESIEKLSFLHCFIKEVLRMYPPIALIPPKKFSKDVILGDFFLPKGTLVGVSVLDIHMNEEIYENPQKFVPERWEKDAKKKIPHYAWIPFSNGPRICIGNNFSIMEQKIFFTSLLMKYELSFEEEKQEIEISENSGLFQSPKPVTIKFKKFEK
jgi:cytochrome P450